MKKRFLTVMMMTLFLTAFTTQAIANGFNDSDFKGEYAFSFSGNFKQVINPNLPPEGTIQEVGIFKPDGNGNIKGSSANSLINGTIQIGGFYEGTYSLNSEGFIDMSVDRFDGSTPPNLLVSALRFVGVIGDQSTKTIQFFIRSDEPTTEINILGSGIKQFK